jgi:hypothetical protein
MLRTASALAEGLGTPRQSSAAGEEAVKNPRGVTIALIGPRGQLHQGRHQRAVQPVPDFDRAVPAPGCDLQPVGLTATA